MADENKPAFYPRVGSNIAKNFRSAQSEPFVDDPRAMDLPQFGDVDLGVPSKANLELSRRIAQRDADLKRQQDADMSPLEKIAGGLQAARFMGSALTQGINSLPTRAVYGNEAADKFMQDRIYKPTQPKAMEYAGDIGDFLEKLETEYKMPQVLPEVVALQYLSAPAKSQAMQAAIKQGMKLEKSLDPMVTQALERGGLPRDLLTGLAQGAQSNVIKPKGGNFLAGSVEQALKPYRRDLQTGVTAERALDLMRAQYTPEALAMMPEVLQQGIARNFTDIEQRVAMNKFIDSNLTNYIKKEMATPEDPVRKLAEQGILHSPMEDGLYRVPESVKQTRFNAGMPVKGMAQSDLAQAYEHMSDAVIKPYTVDFLNNAQGKANKVPLVDQIFAENPWLKNKPPEEIVYALNTNDFSRLGFDHILDVLREDVAAGRIRPEQLNKVSMEQAVRRTHEYDQEMLKKMRETQLKQQEGFPLHKEYPKGYKWIELSQPKELPAGHSVLKDDITGSYKVVDSNGKEAVDRLENSMGHINVPFHKTAESAIAEALRYDKRLEDALKYEGNTMGHCVGGYCPDVLSGDTRIFSLRDAKGEPHVTVEVQPKSVQKAISNLPDAERQALAQSVKDQHFGGVMAGARDEDKYFSLIDQAYLDKYGDPAPNIVQIKGKGNAKPKEDYIPYVQDFVKSGNWSDIGDFKNTGLVRENGQLMTPAEHADYLLKQLGNPPPEGMKRGGVAISKNPDTMMLELSNQKMKNGVPAYSGAGAVIKQGLKAASEAERALPLRLPRALPKPLSEINAHAERVARQIMGEHVTSGKAGDTKNLAGRSMKESQRVKGLEYELVPTKNVPESQVVESKIGDINVALPGDFTVSDVELKSLMGEPIGSRQEGGSRYGLGHMEDETPLFYASNEGPAQQVQDKVTDLYNLYGPERVMGHHMAMGPIATNFAQHFADANLRRIDYSKLRPADMNMFDQIMAGGYEVTKKNKKGESFTKIVDFPDWPGIADPQAAYEAMKNNPEMRKFFNRISQTPSITQPLGFPNAQDVRYAITSPDLRDMEVNLTGHGIGRMVPGGALTDTADHNTYLKGIQGIYEGHQDVLSPFVMSFPDAAEHIMSTQRPQDFTGTIQKVFPHQRIDQQFIDEMEQYRRRVKELTGKKKGGTVKKAAGGKVTPQVKKADGGAINYNTAPDMSDGGRIIQGAPYKRGGKVSMTTNRDTMFMELSNKKLKRK